MNVILKRTRLEHEGPWLDLNRQFDIENWTEYLRVAFNEIASISNDEIRTVNSFVSSSLYRNNLFTFVWSFYLFFQCIINAMQMYTIHTYYQCMIFYWTIMKIWQRPKYKISHDRIWSHLVDDHLHYHLWLFWTAGYWASYYFFPPRDWSLPIEMWPNST